MNEIDLIKEVEKRPILYDRSVSGFNKTKLRDEAWKEVQDALGVTESECKKRWRSLRDSFIKLQRTHGGRTRWPYHLAMKFLLPHLENKTDAGVKREAEESEGEEEGGAEAYSPAGHDDDSAHSLPAKRPRRTSDSPDTPCQCNRSDPDELFLLSCAPSLRRLSAHQNAAARLTIQQALYEAEFGAAQPDSDYSSNLD